MTFNTRGIVLKRQNIREAERLYTVYTADYGKIQALAKGARKIKSKLSPHLESFGEVDLMIARGKNIAHLAGAHLTKVYKSILADPEKISAASYCLNTLDRLTGWETGDEKVYDLLKKTLELFNREIRLGSSQLVSCIQDFIWRLLPLLGYRSELYRCVSCGCKIIPGGQAFDLLKQNELICSRCQ